MLKKTPKSEKAPEEKRDVMRAYLEDGATWEHNMYRSLSASRNRAWMVALVAGIIACLCLLTLLLLLPLKQFEPYVITVDKSTGFIEVARGLHPGPLTQDEAITQSYLVRYIVGRESYDPSDLQKQYDLITLFSEGDALTEYQAIYSSTNPNNPTEVYAYDTTVNIAIKSITFLNDRTASVRFQRTEKDSGQERVSHWISIMSFRYVDKPILQKDRFQNPLGFQVGSYRIDQEALAE